MEDGPSAPSWDEVVPRLGAILTGTLYVDGGPAPVVRVGLLPRLYLHALIDGEPPRIVLATDAGRWGRTHADILAAAIARMVGAEIGLEPVEDGPVRRVVPAPGSATWLVMPGFLRSLEQDLGAPVACAVPTGSTCLLAPRDDPAALDELYALALDVFLQAERPLSPVVYALDDESGLIEPFAPPESEPEIVARAARAERELERHAYAEQKAAMAEALAEREVDVLIGDLTVVELPGVGWTTTTVLIELEDALLPVAEHLFIGYEGPRGPRRMIVALEDLERVAPGLLLASPDFEPPRMGVVRAMTEGEIEALWEAATLKEEGIPI